jgi:sulfur dioxygenase
MELMLTQLNPHSCKTYMVQANGSKDTVLVDPVLEHFREYWALIRENGLNLTHVIDTHTHADHISGAAALKDVTGCEYVMHSEAPAHCVNFRVHDGFEWRLFDEISVKVIHTPGHTQDSVCLILDGIILTGDTLFLDDGGAGRDDLPGGDPNLHWKSLRKLASLPGELTVYPAHDYRNRVPSSLSQQKQTNPYFKPRSKQEFTRYLEDLRLGPADWMKDVLKANYACARNPRAAWIPVDVPACEVKGTLEPGVNEISVGIIPPSVLTQMLASENPPVLLDVREQEELAGELGHLEGIVHVPIGSLAHRLQELQKYRNSEIVTICRSGARAYTAAQILKKAGFTAVSVLNGGMIAVRTSK